MRAEPRLNKRIFLHVIPVLKNKEIILYTPLPNYCGYVEKIWVSATIKVWRLCGNNRWKGQESLNYHRYG